MVDGDIVGSVIVTGDNVSVELNVGPENGALLEQVGVRQRPRVREQRPAPPAGRRMDHLDREGEATRALALLAGGPVNVHGEPGIGKTYLLRDLAGRTPGGGRDGVAFVYARAKSRPELLQELFDAFFDSTPPTKPSEAQIVRALGRRKPAAVFDALELERDDAEALVSVLPSVAIVAASKQACACSGTARRCVSKG